MADFETTQFKVKRCYRVAIQSNPAAIKSIIVEIQIINQTVNTLSPLKFFKRYNQEILPFLCKLQDLTNLVIQFPAIGYCFLHQ